MGHPAHHDGSVTNTRGCLATRLLPTTGPTEAINLLIKRIKRVGFGFRNFDNYRLRLLLHSGVDWHTAHATPVRGRLSRLLGGVEPVKPY